MNRQEFTLDGLSQSRQQLITRELAPILAQTFGYHALLYSTLAKKLSADNLCIKNQIVIADDNQSEDREIKLSMKCRFEELPISSDTIDLAFLPNILQTSINPHQVLREVERVLIPEGVVILIGRNPFSWQGIKAVYYRWRQKNASKTNASFMLDLSRSRISDWFGLLGLQTENQINISVTNQKVQSSHAYFWIKKLAQYFCNYFCSYYIIVATKKVSTLTPIRPSWRSNKQLVPSRITEPSVVSQVENWFEKIRG